MDMFENLLLHCLLNTSLSLWLAFVLHSSYAKGPWTRLKSANDQGLQVRISNGWKYGQFATTHDGLEDLGHCLEILELELHLGKELPES